MTSGLLSSYEGHLRKLQEVWQGNMNASRGEAGDQVSLSRCYSDTGIPIHVQEESGIVTFRSIEIHVSLEVSNGCQSSCPDEKGT